MARPASVPNLLWGDLSTERSGETCANLRWDLVRPVIRFHRQCGGLCEFKMHGWFALRYVSLILHENPGPLPCASPSSTRQNNALWTGTTFFRK